VLLVAFPALRRTAKKDCSMRQTTLLRTVAWTLLVLALLANSAEAQTQLPPAPGAPTNVGDWLSSDGDPRTVGYLNQLFGPLFAAEGGAEETVFSRIIGILNLLVLAIGGLLFTYNIVVGVLQTAHEGQVLGRRWSSLWAPLRIVFASALLIPLPNGGGYNSLQYIVGYLVKGSTTGANAVWAEVTDAILTQSVPIAGATPPHYASIIQHIWNMEVCRAVVRLQYRDAGLWDGSSSLSAPIVGDTREEMRALLDNPMLGNIALAYFVDESAIIRFGGRPGSGLPEEVCGAIALPEVPASILEAERDQAPAPSGQAAAPSWDALIPSGEFRKAHLEAVVGAILALRPAAEAAVANAAARGQTWPSLDLAKISADIRTLLNERVLAVVRETSTNSERARRILEEFLAEAGWTEAGAWYMLLARINNELTQVLGATSTAAAQPGYIPFLRRIADPGSMTSYAFQMGAGPAANLGEDAAIEQAVSLKGGADQVFFRAAARAPEAQFRVPSSLIYDAAGGGDVVSDFILEEFGLTGADILSPVLATFDPGTAGDPMLAVINLGSEVLTVLSGAIAAVVGAAVLTNVALAFLQAIDAFTNLIFAAAAGAAIMLPLMPFLIWVIAVTGYFLLVAEAVIAAPLWAIAHLRADGEGISGQAAARGYSLLLALTLTPVLMLFGLVVGMVIYKITGTMVNIGFYYVMQSMMTDSVVSIAWLVGFSLLLVLLLLAYLVIIERSFSYIATLPANVLRWIDASLEIDTQAVHRAQVAGAGATYATARIVGPVTRAAVAGGQRSRLLLGPANRAAPGGTLSAPAPSPPPTGGKAP
jgi:conjugal transfer/type IV secretion protein DotA/TraY